MEAILIFVSAFAIFSFIALMKLVGFVEDLKTLIKALYGIRELEEDKIYRRLKENSNAPDSAEEDLLFKQVKEILDKGFENEGD